MGLKISKKKYEEVVAGFSAESGTNAKLDIRAIEEGNTKNELLRSIVNKEVGDIEIITRAKNLLLNYNLGESSKRYLEDILRKHEGKK